MSDPHTPNKKMYTEFTKIRLLSQEQSDLILLCLKVRSYIYQIQMDWSKHKFCLNNQDFQLLRLKTYALILISDYFDFWCLNYWVFILHFIQDWGFQIPLNQKVIWITVVWKGEVWVYSDCQTGHTSTWSRWIQILILFEQSRLSITEVEKCAFNMCSWFLNHFGSISILTAEVWIIDISLCIWTWTFKLLWVREYF